MRLMKIPEPLNQGRTLHVFAPRRVASVAPLWLKFESLNTSFVSVFAEASLWETRKNKELNRKANEWWCIFLWILNRL